MAGIPTDFSVAKKACKPIANPLPPTDLTRILDAENSVFISGATSASAQDAASVDTAVVIDANQATDVDAPVDLTSKSSAVIGAPDITTAEDAAIIDAPSEAAPEDASTTPAPTEATAETAISIDTPSALTGETETAISAPSEATAEAATSIDTPSATTAESAAAIDTPTANTPEDASTTPLPSTIAGESATAIDTPSTLSGEAATAIDTPSALTGESAASTPVPTEATAETAATIDTPDAATAKAAATTSAPSEATAKTAATVSTPTEATAQSEAAISAPSSLTAQTGTATTPPFNLNHPRILYDNMLHNYTSVSDSETTGTGLNALKPNTYEKWRFSAASNTLVIDLPSGSDFDAVCIGAHNLGSAGATVAIAYEPEPGGTFYVLETRAITSNNAIWFHSSSTLDALTIEVRVTGASGVPEVGYVSAGIALQMQRPIFNGHTPITDADETTYYSNMSESGEIIGQQIRRQGYSTTAEFQNIDDTWYRSYFAPFKQAAKLQPFFFAWNLLEYSGDVGLCRLNSDIKTSMQNGFVTKRSGLSIPLLGVG